MHEKALAAAHDGYASERETAMRRKMRWVNGLVIPRGRDQEKILNYAPPQKIRYDIEGHAPLQRRKTKAPIQPARVHNLRHARRFHSKTTPPPDSLQ
jgi:hypothetical protein